MTSSQQEEFQTNPRFIGYKFPESINKPETLEKRYIGKLSKKALNLMKGMLEMDPNERYNALECLADPYFDGLREPEVEKMINGKIPGLVGRNGMLVFEMAQLVQAFATKESIEQAA